MFLGVLIGFFDHFGVWMGVFGCLLSKHRETFIKKDD